MRSENTAILKPSRLRVSNYVLGAILVFTQLLGCNQRTFSESSVAPATEDAVYCTDQSESALVIDLGYIALGSELTFCLPLSRLGLPPDANITSIQSSCDCVEGEMLRIEAKAEVSCVG